jgi:hypothetical protein
MSDIPNTEYITVNKDGIFVGGKPAEKYRGEYIWNIDGVKRVFAWMQEQNPEIEEFHIGAFATRGEYTEIGNPDGAFGPNAWCRVKYKNGNLGAWVFIYTSGSAAYCAHSCASSCAHNVRGYASFRSAVLGSAIEKQNVNPMAKSKNQELKKLEQVDFSKLPKSPIELNGYEIVVRKLKIHTK